MTDEIQIKTVPVAQAKYHEQEIAEMRLKLFSEYPYLYEGTHDIEQQYLQRYFISNQSLVVLVFNKEKIVGLSLGLPLIESTPHIRLSAK